MINLTRLKLALFHPRAMLSFMHLMLLRKMGHRDPIPVRLKDTSATFYVDPFDEGISRDLKIWREREVHATRIFKKYLRPGQTIIDVGANIGYYVMIEAEVIGNTGRIYAIEPSPDNVSLLRHNVEANGFSDFVHIDHGAITDETGTVTLHMAHRSNMHTLKRTPKMDNYVEFTGAVDVSAWSLDDYLEEKGIDPTSVDIIRMDIEGHENMALEGMRRTLEVASPLLYIEVHPQLIREGAGEEGFRKFLDQLEEAGYELEPSAMSLSSRHDQDSDMTSLRDLEKVDEAVEAFFVKRERTGEVAA